MLNLSTELVKNSTTLERLEHLDELTAHLTGVDCEVWALRASDTFPRNLIPSDSKGYLCYMGIYPVKVATDYGQINFLTFGQQRFVYLYFELTLLFLLFVHAHQYQLRNKCLLFLIY